MDDNLEVLEAMRSRYPEKFVPEQKIFAHIRRGDRIFVGTSCGEPQYLLHALVSYLESHPNALFDTELLHVWTLGVDPKAGEKLRRNFRYNSFFVGDNSREAVNSGRADYTPVFLSQVPGMFQEGSIPIDVALIQTTLPNEHGFLGLGVSVDIVKAATECASLVIAQMNSEMPQVQGDGFLHIEDAHFLLHHDEPLLVYQNSGGLEESRRIGEFVARIVQDGDTIQVGYGSTPNAVLSQLSGKKHLGVHTELLTDGIVALMKRGVIDNTRKNIDRGRTVAAFCMGTKQTYQYLHNNPAIELRSIDYTNNPLIVSQHDNLVAINSALEIDLTGQATAESLGGVFYSGIGGQADFMRGATLSRNGQTVLALPSTARDGTVSRIVPFLKEGTGVTLNRGDVRYVVTEYGIAFLRAKSIRERAMELIAIAHPKFRPWLLEEAKRHTLIYPDQMFVPGDIGEYPQHLETYRTTKSGTELFLRPVRMSDEPLIKELFHRLSDRSIETRFFSARADLPHEFLQRFVAIDHSRQTIILAIKSSTAHEELLGIGQYWVGEDTNNAYVAFTVRDDYQNKGIGTELLTYLIYLARRQGLRGFIAEIMLENTSMIHLFEKTGLDIEKKRSDGVYTANLSFRKKA